jgi:acyl-CoA synthetase (AMP-forming)/AMP-acid ligase II
MTPLDADTVLGAFAIAADHHAEHDFLHIPATACRAYADGALNFTYVEAHAKVQALATCYRAAGVGPGHRVALLLENRPAFFFHWFALNGLGASVVPINPDYRKAELEYLLDHSEVVAAIALADRVPDLLDAAAKASRPVLVFDEARVATDLPTGHFPKGADVATGRDGECAILYTSGTTGRPKGCILSNEYLLRMGLRYLNRRGPIKLRPGESRLLTPLPMFHMNAMAASTMGVVASGSCLIQLDRFHPNSWWADVASSRPTGIHYLGVMPAILLSMPEDPLERLHGIEYGAGANVEPAHHAAFERRFGIPLIEGWAMTETGSGAAISADDEPRHLGSRCFGKVPATVELRLVDDAGNDVPKGQPGEMLVRHAGPDKRLGFFSGYLKDPVATQAGWAGGWWHTGDVARFGEDGSLHFVDRKKNVIRRSGENISALEVEAVLLSHPSIAQVAVSAVADEVRGEEVMACIVPAPGASASPECAAAIVDWTMERLAYYKAPGWISFVEELPTTATQKVQRGALRDLTDQLLRAPDTVDLRARKRRTSRAHG